MSGSQKSDPDGRQHTFFSVNLCVPLTFYEFPGVPETWARVESAHEEAMKYSANREEHSTLLRLRQKCRGLFVYMATQGKTMKDISGQQFGRLIVIERAGTNQNRVTMWKCRCSCGVERIVVGSDLRRGHTTSCGCAKREISREVNSTHRDSKTRLYKIWKGVRQRCNNPANKDYPRYGGRGITFAPEWEDWNQFKCWARSHGYAPDLTLERIDNDGAYSPENCRWITHAQQAKNKRQTIWRDGMCLKDYCKEYGLSYWKELEKAKARKH